MALIDPHGEHHDISKHVQLKNTTDNRRNAPIIRTSERKSSFCIRSSKENINPSFGLLIMRLIPNQNYSPEPLDRNSKQCCRLHRRATNRQVRAQLLRWSICNVAPCSTCFPVFRREQYPQYKMKQVHRVMTRPCTCCTCCLSLWISLIWACNCFARVNYLCFIVHPTLMIASKHSKAIVKMMSIYLLKIQMHVA